MIVPLHDLLRGLVSVHDGHIQVHKNEAVLLLAALFVKVVMFEHINSLQAIHGFIAFQVKIHPQDQLKRDQIKAVVINYQN